MYRISEVSKIVGLPIPTIRYYEKLGLIDTPAKGDRATRHIRKERLNIWGLL